MSKHTARQKKQRLQKIMVSSIAMLLVAVLVIGLITMAIHAVENTTLDITVTDGTNPISGATVTIEQVSDATVEEEETVAELLKTIDLTGTDAWKKGYFNVSSGSPGTFRGEETVPNAKIYRTDLIAVEGSEYITLTAPTHYDSANGGYYKWRLLWFGTNSQNGTVGATTNENIDFVGFSSEQSDLSQDTKFAVPEGACYVRIAIASVVSGKAVTPFPVDTFCNDDGGLKVELYRNKSTVQNVSIKDTGVLEAGSIDAATGSFVDSATHSRTNAPFSTEGATMLAVSFPSTSDVSYKWRVLFYNNNTFVSAAAEQTDLDAQVYFDVPDGANQYKIAFTSVANDIETAIDLPVFSEGDGIYVTLYGASAVQQQKWITDSGTTGADGKVSFSVPAGANYKYTVTADGYISAAQTVTAAQYASGITVALEKKIDYSSSLDITVSNGISAIPGATVKVEQIFDSSLMRQDTVKLEYVGGFSNLGGSCQGGGIYDHYYVQVEKGSGSPITVWFHIFDLETNKQIATVSMAGDGGAYKNNNANFGTEFYQESDPFPLLYISSAYDARTVAVRIYQDGETWKAEQVQVIDYSGDLNNANGFYSCNVMLDNENGFMYLTPINADYTSSSCTKQWFYKFNMPKLSDGYEVIITREDALEERIETAYEFAPQGGCLLDGKVYQTFGYGSSSRPGKVCIFDLATGEYETKIDVTALGCSGEPESGGFYNGSYYFITVSGRVYKMTPSAYLPEEETENTDTLLSTIILNQDADWEVGFLESVSTPKNLLVGQEYPQGNKIYRTGLVDVSGTDYIYIPKPSHYDSANGGYYKWKLYFFGPNAQTGATTAETIDFVACASEQSDFSTTNKFAVPEGAAYVRICIASVLSTGTQSTFPEATFLSDGGLTVQRYDAPDDAVEKTTLWLEGESAASDADGNVHFDVVPGASFKITISAPGYMTVAKTVTAVDYLEGITVSLTALSPGDANGDDFVDAFDAALVKKYSIGTLAADDLYLSVLDLDGDGVVDAFDAALIQKYCIGAIKQFPVNVNTAT